MTPQDDLLDWAMAVLASHIDVDEWGARGRVVAAILAMCVQAPDGVARCGWRRLASVSRTSERNLRWLLGPVWHSGPERLECGAVLVREEYVVCRGQVPGWGRSRGTEWTLTPALGAWQRVPWHAGGPPYRDVAPLLGEAGQWRAQATVNGARNGARTPPSMARVDVPRIGARNGARTPLSMARVDVPRIGAARAIEDPPARAIARAIEDPPARAIARAIEDPPARAIDSATIEDPPPFVSGFSKTPKEGRKDERRESAELDGVAAAVMEATGLAGVWGSARVALGEVLDELGADEALRRARLLPGPRANGRSGVTAPVLAEALRSIAPTRVPPVTRSSSNWDEPLPPRPDPTDARARLAEARAGLGPTSRGLPSGSTGAADRAGADRADRPDDDGNANSAGAGASVSSGRGPGPVSPEGFYYGPVTSGPGQEVAPGRVQMPDLTRAPQPLGQRPTEALDR